MTMNVNGSERRFDTVVIGGGQAGLDEQPARDALIGTS
jgi:hypothetical protein